MQELNGKVSINFRNERTLRELTKMLLLEYFDLHVDFAPGSLVPTLALRLNYILWLEDLLAPLKLDAVCGIDIGKWLALSQENCHLTNLFRLRLIVHLFTTGSQKESMADAGSGVEASKH